MRITIIGSGDISSIHKNAKINPKDLKKLLKNSAKLVAESGAEIIILPAKGIPYEFARLYKKFGGKKILGVIPKGCHFYGRYTDKIIGNYLDVIDEKINFKSWYDVDGNIATLGDYTLCFGLSSGVLAEISEMKYNILYRGKETKLIIFENTISKKLHGEVEVDIKPIYIKSVDELKDILLC